MATINTTLKSKIFNSTSLTEAISKANSIVENQTKYLLGKLIKTPSGWSSNNLVSYFSLKNSGDYWKERVIDIGKNAIVCKLLKGGYAVLNSPLYPIFESDSYGEDYPVGYDEKFSDDVIISLNNSLYDNTDQTYKIKYQPKYIAVYSSYEVVLAEEIDYEDSAGENIPNPEIYVEPYIPIDQIKLNISIPTHNIRISTKNAEILSSSTKKITKIAGEFDYEPSLEIKEGTHIALFRTKGKFLSRLQLIINGDKFKNVFYAINKLKQSSFKVYVGKRVGDDFLNAFEIVSRKQNDYKTIDTVEFVNIKMVNKRFKFETNKPIEVVCEIDGQEIKLQTEYLPIELASGQKAFQYVVSKSHWQFDDKLDLKKINFKNINSKLTYADDTTIGFGELEWLTNPYATTSLSNPNPDGTFTLVEGTPDFTITEHYNLKYFGQLENTYTNDVQGVGEHYAVSGKLIKTKSNFTANEILQFDPTAEIELYNINGLNFENLKQPLIGETKITEPPKGFGLPITKEYYTDSKISKEFRVKDRFNIPWDITIDYFDNFQIDTSLVKKLYYYGDSFTFDEANARANIVAKITKHKNSVGLGETELITIDNSKLTFTYGDISVNTGSKRFNVYVNYVDEYNDKQQAIYQITVTKIEPHSLKLSGVPNEDTITYWNNNGDKFKKPTGFEYTIINTDGSTKVLDEIYISNNIQYYRTEDYSEAPLTANDVIKVGDGNYIYVKDTLTNVTGKYVIRFKEDLVENLTYGSRQEPITFILGNKFNSIKSQLRIVATYTSGVSSYIDNSRFDFKNNNLILEPTDLEIVLNEKVYNLKQEHITFTAPEVKNVEFLLNGFETTYTNISDYVNCSNIKLKVSYVNSEFTNTLSFTANPIVGLKDKFNVSSDKTLNIDKPYVFDGSVPLNTDMADESQIDVPLKFTFNNYFKEATHTEQLPITILEVLDITGISIKQVKNEYLIGENFLNETDDTIVTIFFNDKQGKQKKINVKLNSGFAAINILPAKGTQFRNTNNALLVQVTSATNHDVRAEYTIRVKPKIQSDSTKVHNIVAVKVDTYNAPKDIVLENKYLLIDEVYNGTITTELVNEIRVLKKDIDITKIKVYGYLEDINNDLVNAKVILFDDYLPPIDGTNNIEVTYPCYVKGNADKINKCHIGTLFGSNNTRNRLFLSGNKDIPNIDYHSAAIKENSFGYVEDTSYCAYGETDSAIVGYAKVADNKLLVLKTKSDKDSTVWFRIPVMVTAINGAGTTLTNLDGQALHQEEFSRIKGNNTVAGVNPQAVLNFNGDTLFLSSDNEIVGLDYVGVLGDNQRYANSRSYYIDGELKQIANKHTWLWSNNKYLFAVLDKKIYVSHFEQIANKQYEWLPINVEDVQAILELDNDLYFGNSKGQFYKKTNAYDDIIKIFVGDEQSIVVAEKEDDNKVIVPYEIIDQLDNDKKYKFKPIPATSHYLDYMYYKIAKISNNAADTFDLFVNAEKNTLDLMCFVDGKQNFDRLNKFLKSYSEDKYCYLNHYDYYELSPDEEQNVIFCKQQGDVLTKYGVRYKLKRYDDVENISEYTSYKLYDENNNEMDVRGLLRANLCYRLDGDYDIGNIHKEVIPNLRGNLTKQSYFNLMENGDVIDIVRYADQGVQKKFKAEIKYFRPVESFYITKPYTMGDLNYFKTIWQSTLTNDTNIPSELELTYVDNKIPFEKQKTISLISYDSLSLDFSDLSFKALDLMKTNVPRTFTITGVMPNLKSITFGFRNYNNTNSVLCGMSIIYSVPMQSYSGD